MNKYQTFDKEEQQIFKAFSQIEVSTDNLERSIANVNHKRAKRPMKLSFAMVALAVFLLLSGTVYAATGGLEQFLERFNPNFGEFVVAPLEPAYTEDQGIRFEVYGAQLFHNVAIIYYSLEDVSGENRLNDRTGLEYTIFTDTGLAINTGAGTERLHFDRRNNRLYFEARVIIQGPLPSQLRIGGRRILYYPERGGQVQTFLAGDWVVEVSIDDTVSQILIWEDVIVNDVHIDSIILSPLGVYVAGSYLDCNWDMNDYTTWRSWPDIMVECSRGHVNAFSGGSGGIGACGFDFFLYSRSPIDIAEVAAVIVNGSRIPTP